MTKTKKMRKFTLIFLSSIFFISCGKQVASTNGNNNTQESAPAEEEAVSAVPLNDSLQILIPRDYSGEGMWSGEDTWGFTMRRNDEKVIFYHETGPGTPYQPMEIKAGKIPEELFDHKAEAVFRKSTKKLNGYFYYKELQENEIRNMKGRFFLFNSSTNSMKEVLEINFADNAKEEVINILGSIEQR